MSDEQLQVITGIPGPAGSPGVPGPPGTPGGPPGPQGEPGGVYVAASPPDVAADATLPLWVDISEDGEPTVVPSTGVTTEFIADGAVTQAKLDRVRQRVTHPNTTDTLIEVWDDGAGAWVVSDYDSGWRDVSSLLDAGFTTKRPNGVLYLRRIGDVCEAKFAESGVPTASPGAMWTSMPIGFRSLPAKATGVLLNADTGAATSASWLITGAVGDLFLTVGWSTAPLLGSLMWTTPKTLPASLPGTPA